MREKVRDEERGSRRGKENGRGENGREEEGKKNCDTKKMSKSKMKRRGRNEQKHKNIK